MQLFKKQNDFLIVFCIFELWIKFWIFWKKDDTHSLYISEITDYEKRG